MFTVFLSLFNVLFIRPDKKKFPECTASFSNIRLFIVTMFMALLYISLLYSYNDNALIMCYYIATALIIMATIK
ncbi:hypothetical protein MIDIC_40005 [Alphaproteobacteria bacterium]